MIPELHVVYGPPGTGKTTKLLSILQEELTKGVKASRIAYVSFTQEGAYQGRSRAKETFTNLGEKDFLYFRTLHSLAFRSLGLKRSQVMNASHYKKFSELMGMHFIGYYTEEFNGIDDKYLFYDQLNKNNSETADRYLGYLDMDKLAHVQKNYREYKKIYGVYDFTDMIQIFVERKQKVDVDVAFVDEAQDLTTLQWQMVWVAFSGAQRIYIAGDDDQAIYEWSGADVKQFLGLHTTSTQILSKSHRLPNDILDFSKRITKHISIRADKPYRGNGTLGRIIRVGTFSDVTFRPDETYMFLARNKIFLEPIAEWLRGQGIIFDLMGKPSFSMQEYRLIVLYEQQRKKPGAIENTNDLAALAKNTKRDATMDTPWYDAFDWDQVKLDYYRDVIRTKPDSMDPMIRVSTIHSVKGAEADHVILLPDVTRKVMDNLERNPDSEHRAFYVACTRAKKSLYICDPSSKFAYPIMEL